MKLNAGVVKEKLQNEKNCVIYVYLSGGNFAYDTELKEGCIGKISGLKMEEKRKSTNFRVEAKRVSVSHDAKNDVRITNGTLAVAYLDYEKIQKTVVELICKQMGCEKGTVLPQSSLVNDIGCDSLDTVDLLMDIEKRMGISIYDVADTHFFDRPETTVEDVCQGIHQWINQAYGKAEQ